VSSASKRAKPRFVMRDGKRMAVLRPDKPSVALAMAGIALAHNETDLFARLPESVQEITSGYRFMGWLAIGGRDILDHDGTEIGHPLPGDSFVTFNEEPEPA
jgi:hypothetical protein